MFDAAMLVILSLKAASTLPTPAYLSNSFCASLAQPSNAAKVIADIR
jgi:hypothetical protein